MGTYRVGVIGCGSIGRAHAYGWTNNERTELVALADMTPAARDEFGEEFGVPEAGRYAAFREMVEKGSRTSSPSASGTGSTPQPSSRWPPCARS